MASVTRDGRIVLYYQGGQPVYADSNDSKKDNLDIVEGLSKRGFDPNNPDTDNSHTGLHTYNRRHQEDRRFRGHDDNGDHNEGLPKRQVVQKLVRGKDGLLNLIYVDPKTGKEVKNLNNVSVVTSMSTLDDIYGKPAKSETKDDTDTNTDTETDQGRNKKQTRRDQQHQDSFNDHGRSGQRSSASKSTSSVGTSNTNNTAEQGDTTDYSRFDPLDGGKTITSTPREVKSSLNQDPSVATTTQSVPNNYENQHPAYATSLSDLDYNYENGNLSTPYEGKNLNDVVTYGDQKDYTDAQVTDVAKTLAGEIDSRYTDINSPEGQKEAAGIVSTMMNRDDVMQGDISDAIHQPNAYSTWNNDQVAKVAEANYAKNPAMWEGLARQILSDPTQRQPYTNYYNPSLVNPSWADDLGFKEQIGPHMFGVDQNYAPTQHYLSEDQKNAIETNAINTSFQNSFAFPASQELTNNPITVSPVYDPTSFAAAYAAQKMPESMSLGVAPSNVSGFSLGYQAQRDYVDPNTEGWPSIDSPEVKQMDQNNLDHLKQMEQERAAPNVTANSNFSTGYDAQKSYNVDNFDSSRFGDPTPANLGSFTQGYDAQKDYNTQNFDTSRFGDPTPADLGNFTQGYQAQKSTLNANVPSMTDTSRIAPDYSATTGFATGYQPSISPSNTGVYGDPTGGFGNYVSTDKNAVADSGLQAAENTAKINDAVSAGFTAPGSTVSNSIANTAPSISVDSTSSNTSTDSSADTSTSSTPDASTSNTGDGVSTGTTTSSFSSSSNDGVSSGPVSTGFTSSLTSDTTSTGTTVDSGISVDSDTSGVTSNTGGFTGGIFGGFTSSDTSDTSSTSSVGDSDGYD